MCAQSQASGTLLNVLCKLGEFIRRFRVIARFGDLSRAPLELLRVEIEGQHAECEWMARMPDEWDADLPKVVGQRNHSLQALQDAIAVRSLLFRTLPDVRSAMLRVHRWNRRGERELVIVGEIMPGDKAPKSVMSVVMQAKLLGLHFEMNEGILEELRQELCGVTGRTISYR